MISKKWILFGVFLLFSLFKPLGAQEISHKVIPTSIRQNADSVYINFLEQAYASHLQKTTSPRFNDIEIIQGSWGMLEHLNDSTRCEIVHDRSNFTITLSTGYEVFTFRSPIHYQKFHIGSRDELENGFLKALLEYQIDTSTSSSSCLASECLPENDGIFILKGEYYLNRAINSNAYLTKNIDGTFNFIVTPKQPVATIANMVIHGVGYSALFDISVSAHEYGSIKKAKVPLEQFRQYCIHEGCKLYWGFEEYEADILKGSLICHNEREGYEHIVRITCHPSDLGNQEFEMSARVSLFVPTTNTADIFLNE